MNRLSKWLYTKAVSDQFVLNIMGSGCCYYELEQYLNRQKDGKNCLLTEQAEETDVLIVTGPISYNYLPELIKVTQSLSEHSLVVVLGSCTLSGGHFRGPMVVDHLTNHIQVDYFVQGCPVRLEDIDSLFQRIPSLIFNKVHQLSCSHV